MLLMCLNTKTYTLDLDEFIKSGEKDMKYLIKGYMSPFADSFSKSLNSGWYNTAKVHSVLGFDFTIGGSFVFIPSSGKEFIINNKDLTNFELSSGETTTKSPTFYGDNKTVELKPKGTITGLNNFSTPAGIGINYALGLAPQIGLGLPLGFEIRAKFFPQVSIGDYGEIGLWGIALRHDVLQHIPIAEKIPFLNVSIMAAYSNLNCDISINQENDLPEQNFNTSISSFTTNLCASADIPILTAFISLGYGANSSNFTLEGEFEVPVINETNPTNFTSKIINNPIDFSVSSSDFRATAGVMIKLALFHIFADYTMDGDYSIATVGCAISFR